MLAPPDPDWSVEEVVAPAPTPEVPVAAAGGGRMSRYAQLLRRYGDGTGPFGLRPFRRARATVVRQVPNYNYQAVRVVWYVTEVLEVLLVMRFFLKLLGASAHALFTVLVYGLTELFVLPFSGIFGHPAGAGLVFESSSFVSILIYPLLGWAVTVLIRIRTARRHPLEKAPKDSESPGSSSGLYG